MAAGDLISQDVQVELRGLLIGEGTDYPITAPIEGLGDLEVRQGDLPRPLAHGLFAGPQFYGGRTLRIPYAILGDDADDAVDKLVELGAAVRVITALDGDDVTTIPLVLRLPGGLRLTSFGKPTRNFVDTTSLPNAKGRTIRGVIEFRGTDPRLYGDEQSGTASPGAVVGGLSLPHGFPHGFGSATPGTIQATNDGNFPTYPTAVITGGSGGTTGFAITRDDTGEELSVTLDIAEDDFVVVDFAERTVLAQGISSRSGFVDRPASVWWELPPGTTPVAFSVASGNADLVLYWRDAYVFG